MPQEQIEPEQRTKAEDHEDERQRREDPRDQAEGDHDHHANGEHGNVRCQQVAGVGVEGSVSHLCHPDHRYIPSRLA